MSRTSSAQPAGRLLTRPVTWVLIGAFLILFVFYHQPAMTLFFSQDDFPLLATTRPGWASPSDFFLIGLDRDYIAENVFTYRPLTQGFYFHLNQRLFDLDARAHHLMNLAVHLLNSLLVGWLAIRWFSPLAGFVSLVIFSLHRVHFYEVFWISGISQSGYVFFLLATLAALENHRRSGAWLPYLGAVCLSAGALLSKEDAFALPAIVTLIAAWRTDWKGGWWREALPFWLLLAAFAIFRFLWLGMRLPHDGVYDFTLSGPLLLDKLVLYGRWLLAGPLFGGALLLFVAVSLPRFKLPLYKDLAVLGGTALFSVTPTFLIPSTAQHYLSLAAACLAWATGLLLAQSAFPFRRSAFALLFAGFLFGAFSERDRLLASRSLDAPIPEKARLCRRWVQQLRAVPAPPYPCTLLFAQVPLREWEADWFASLPRIAWNLPYPDVVVHIRGTDRPSLSDSLCVEAWSLAGGNVSSLDPTAWRK